MHALWEAAQPPQPLLGAEAHVWLARLDPPPAMMAHLLGLLSDEERQKAAHFRFEHDRRHYAVAHAMLRHLLGAYLGMSPHAVTLAATSHGKPYNICQTGLPDLRFNLSHSHDSALVALTLGREIGVDIEYARPLADGDLIATQFFSPTERAALMALPPEQKQTAFYRCWSRKEGVIKATGLGLAMALESFDVTLAPDLPARLLALRDATASAVPWMMYDLPSVPGFACALVVAGEVDRIACYRWLPPHAGTIEDALQSESLSEIALCPCRIRGDDSAATVHASPLPEVTCALPWCQAQR
jgi:4'-phosphopantetheinyl transferase